MSAAGARAFVALALGAELGARVAEVARRELGEERWRLAEGAGLHATLAFLGEVRRDALERATGELRDALEGVAAPRLRLGRTGAFPDAGRPRVLWVAVEEREERGRLERCRMAVLAGLERARVSVQGEHEEFRPHVTVARPRKRERMPRGFAEVVLGWEWDPRAVEVFESRGGGRYAAVGSVGLG